MNRLQALLDMLEESPRDPFLRYAIALEHERAGNRAKAIERLVELLHDEPGYLGTYYQLGKYYESEGRAEEAAKVYTLGQAVAKAQGNQKTFGELGEALMLMDED